MRDETAMARIVCCALCVAVYAGLDIRPWAMVSPVFWMPVSLFRFLPGPPHNAMLLGVLQTVWKISLLTSAVGLFTRFSLLVAAGLGFFVLGLPNCFGKIHHLDGFTVLLLRILLAAPCVDVLAVDRLFSKRQSPGPGSYRWPIWLAQAVFLLTFFSAGLSKLRNSGWAWTAPQNMRDILIANLFNHETPTRWAGLLADSDAFCSFAATATLVVELSALPAIFVPVVRIPVVAALLSLQAGIALVMGIYFVPHLAGYALFVPWQRIWERAHRD